MNELRKNLKPVAVGGAFASAGRVNAGLPKLPVFTKDILSEMMEINKAFSEKETLFAYLKRVCEENKIYFSYLESSTGTPITPTRVPGFMDEMGDILENFSDNEIKMGRLENQPVDKLRKEFDVLQKLGAVDQKTLNFMSYALNRMGASSLPNTKVTASFDL